MNEKNSRRWQRERSSGHETFIKPLEMEIADTVTGSLNGRFELEQMKNLKILNN